MLATKPICDRAAVMQHLREMELDQIANWLGILPAEKWESMFIASWPTLAKKCGVHGLHID